MDIITWLIQLVIFFTVVSGIVSSVSKKNNPKQTSNKRSVFDKPIQTYSASSSMDKERKSKNSERSDRNQTAKNGTPHQDAVKNLTTERERRRKERENLDRSRGRTRQDRANTYGRRSNEPILKEVTTLKQTKVIKKSKNPALLFNDKSMVNAMIHKEVLDKPISVRDDSL